MTLAVRRNEDNRAKVAQRQHARALEAAIPGMARAVSKAFVRLRDSFIHGAEAKELKKGILPINYSVPAYDEFADAMTKILTKQYISVGELSLAGVKEQLGLVETFDLNERIIRNADIGGKVKGITDETRFHLQNTIRNGINDGLHPSVIAKELRDQLNGWAGLEDLTRSRAYTIARTETANAYNLGAVEGYRRSGLVRQLRTIDAPDCGWTYHDDPLLANGRIVDLDTAARQPISHPNCVRAFAPVAAGLEQDLSKQPAAAQPEVDPVTSKLASSLPTDVKDLGGGINTTFTADFNGVKAVVKPTTGTYGSKLREEIPIGAESPRELSAQIINDAMGRPVNIPRIVRRDLQGYGDSIIVEFVESTPGLPLLGYTVEEQRGMALFDGVIGNLDRHPGNYLTGANGELIAIDHGLSFPEADALTHRLNGNTKALDLIGDPTIRGRIDINLSDSDRAKLALLQKSKTQVSSDLLRAGLPQSAVDDVFDRVDFMVKEDRLLASNDFLGVTPDFSRLPKPVWRVSEADLAAEADRLRAVRAANDAAQAEADKVLEAQRVAAPRLIAEIDRRLQVISDELKGKLLTPKEVDARVRELGDLLARKHELKRLIA